MSPRLHLLSAIPLIAAGVLAGRAIPSSADDAPGNTGSMVDRRSRNGATEERGYLARLRATVDRGDSGKLLRPGMERLDIGNLDALAREQMEKNRATGRWSDHRTVADAALAELYRREGAAALERVSRWPDPEERENAVSAIMLLHIYADWESAMSLLEKFPQPVDESWLSAAMKEAAGRNADDFLHVAALMPERDRMDPFSSPRAVEFAADFDFAKVHAEGRLEEGEIYFKEWSYRQPDAAWDAVKDTLSTEVGSGWQPLERILPDLVEGVVGREGELAGMDWLGGKVADLPPEARAALFDVGILGFCVSGEALTRFCSHLPPADVRDYIQGQIHVSKEVFYPVMDQLPRQELIPLLKWMVEGSVWDGEGTAARLQQRFSLTADEVQRIKRATQE